MYIWCLRSSFNTIYSIPLITSIFSFLDNQHKLPYSYYFLVLSLPPSLPPPPSLTYACTPPWLTTLLRTPTLSSSFWWLIICECCRYPISTTQGFNLTQKLTHFRMGSMQGWDVSATVHSQRNLLNQSQKQGPDPSRIRRRWALLQPTRPCWGHLQGYTSPRCPSGTYWGKPPKLLFFFSNFWSSFKCHLDESVNRISDSGRKSFLSPSSNRPQGNPCEFLLAQQGWHYPYSYQNSWRG